MGTVHEISKFLQYSPKRSRIFEEIKCNISPDTMGFRVLCPTRWTVRSEAVHSTLENYVSFLQMWESLLESHLDSDARARVHGFNSQMRTFDFYFGLNMLFILLRHTDNLSKTLQNTQMSAAEGQRLAAMTVTTLESTRNEQAFELFWDKTATESAMLDIGQSAVPRSVNHPVALDQRQSNLHLQLSITTDLRMSVYILMAIDGNGQGEIAMICLTALENEHAITIIVQVFKHSNPSWGKMKVVMSDKISLSVWSFGRNSPKQPSTSVYSTQCGVSVRKSQQRSCQFDLEKEITRWS